MPEIKHNWLQQVAACFGMDVKSFAKYIGYSRQALYQAACGITRLDKGRLAVAQYKLEAESQKIMEAEKAAAEERFIDREKLIDSLMDRLSD